MIRRTLSEQVRDVLLIGCGYGSWISDLLAMSLRVRAIDISPSIISKAAVRHQASGGSVMCADAHELPFSESAFDAVISISTLHHLVPTIAVPELRRVLRSPGILLGSEPNFLNPQVRWMLSSSARRQRGGLTPDETAFRKAELASELRRSFEEVSVTPFDFWHPRLGYRREGHPLITLVRTLEFVPVFREYAGSLWFTARRVT
jgi:SAM-dependent methyltransferase